MPDRQFLLTNWKNNCFVQFPSDQKEQINTWHALHLASEDVLPTMNQKEKK